MCLSILTTMPTVSRWARSILGKPWDKKINQAIFLVGPPGIGKSATIIALSDKYNYKLHFIDSPMISSVNSDRYMETLVTKKVDNIKRLNILDIAEVIPRGVLHDIIKRYSETIISYQPLVVILDTIDYKFSEMMKKKGHLVVEFKPTILSDLHLICRANNVPTTGCMMANGIPRQALMSVDTKIDYSESDMRILVNKFKTSRDHDEKKRIADNMSLPLMNVLFALYLNNNNDIRSIAYQSDLFSTIDAHSLDGREIASHMNFQIDYVKGYAKNYNPPKKRKRDAIYSYDPID